MKSLVRTVEDAFKDLSLVMSDQNSPKMRLLDKVNRQRTRRGDDDDDVICRGHHQSRKPGELPDEESDYVVFQAHREIQSLQADNHRMRSMKICLKQQRDAYVRQISKGSGEEGASPDAAADDLMDVSSNLDSKV